MTDARPDPDALLRVVQAEEARAARGKLKIFFGAAPGVGKTYAMLEAGRKLAKEGVDVLVGHIEAHVRPETYALVMGLDLLEHREVAYRGTVLKEFDLEAALAKRPKLILVDELAHTNAPGMTHAKRWQDVEDLLEAGIDVYTTLNVQHIESLNDIVAQVTTVRVQETVPDAFFDQADEVELVDLPPDDLIERLREGKVYVPEQARLAIEHFFRKGNLIALRELALRTTAERVNAQMQDWRIEHAVGRTWPTSERLLVCVGPSPMSARLIRAARRMAAFIKATWFAVHVEITTAPPLGEDDKQRLAQNLHLAEELGAKAVTLSGAHFAEEVLRFAHEQNVSRIVVGKPHLPRWRELLRGSLVYDLIRLCGDIDVYVISGDESPRPARLGQTGASEVSWRPYLWSLLAVGCCTGIGFLMLPWFAPLNIIMVYLAALVAIAVRLGKGPSILAAVLSVAAFDVCFVPPQGTFAVSDTEYLLTFAVMLATGLVISALTARVKAQAEAARQRERRSAALYDLSRELAALPTPEAIAQAAVRKIAAAVDAQVAVLTPRDKQLAAAESEPAGFTLDAQALGVAQWSFEHREAAGFSTETLPGAEVLCLPLAVVGGVVGVLAVRPTRGERLFEPDRLRLLEAFAGQVALALERTQLAREAEQARLQIETERLRNSLLSAISHDLRTPLAAITGASSTLVESAASLDAPSQRELAEAIFDESERLNRLVGNVLDMTRLEAGALVVHKEWQPLEEVVGVVLQRLARQLRSHPLTTRLPENLPPVPIDGLLIQQVLANLLDNATKYSPPGTPIELSAEPIAGGVQITVADRGPGFQPGETERVFEKFYRGAATGSRSGSGLGLPICRGIVGLHGGRLWAENRPGGGAIFRFTLPAGGLDWALAPPPPASAPATVPAPSAP